MCVDGYKLNDRTNEGIEGWKIFIDQNGDRKFDEGEPNTTSGVDGYWQICGLEPGTYDICEVLLDGWEAVDPDDGCNERRG